MLFYSGSFSLIPSAVWSSLLAGCTDWALTASHKSPVLFFPYGREGRWEERTTSHLVQERKQRRTKGPCFSSCRESVGEMSKRTELPSYSCFKSVGCVCLIQILVHYSPIVLFLHAIRNRVNVTDKISYYFASLLHYSHQFGYQVSLFGLYVSTFPVFNASLCQTFRVFAGKLCAFLTVVGHSGLA